MTLVGLSVLLDHCEKILALAPTMEYGESTECLHILCGAHKALYNEPQKTVTKLPYYPEQYGLSGHIVHQMLTPSIVKLSSKYRLLGQLLL